MEVIMNSTGYSAKSNMKAISLFLILVFLLPAAVAFGIESPSQKKESGKEQIVSEVAKQWLAVGSEQYKKGLYTSAEKSLLRARDYQEYLTDAQRKELNELLDKTHAFIKDRELVLKQLEKADELIARNKLAEAKEGLEKFRFSEFITEEQRQKVLDKLAEVDAKLPAGQKTNMPSEIKKVEEPIKQEQPERKEQVSTPVKKTGEQMKQGESVKTKAGAENIKAEEPSITEKKLLITKKPEKAELQPEQDKEQQEIDALYKRSMEYYRAGESEKARECLDKINKIMAGKVEAKELNLPKLPQIVEESKSNLVVKEPNVKQKPDVAAVIEKPVTAEPVLAKEPDAKEEPKIEAIAAKPIITITEPDIKEPNVASAVAVKEVTSQVEQPADENKIDKKINLLRSYVKAVVKDAMAKAQDYADQKEFDKAAKKIASAKEAVNQNRLHLGEKLFEDYLNKLEQQLNSITQQQQKEAK
jgi:hypothetical protein